MFSCLPVSCHIDRRLLHFSTSPPPENAPAQRRGRADDKINRRECRHAGYAMTDTVLRRLLCALVILMLTGCDNNQTPAVDGDAADGDGVDVTDPDPDVTDADPDRDIEYPLCTPDTRRCQEDSDEYLEKCNASGDRWVLYERCGLDEYCAGGACVSRTADGDEEATEEETGEQEEELSPDCICPGHPEMARVADPDTGEAYCIDRWEATVFENADCTGRVYGQEEGDWPEEFPACVGCGEEEPFLNPGYCNGCEEQQTGGQIDAQAAACSMPDMFPSHYISFFQAYYACLNADKYLCSTTQWEFSCSNANTTNYPYGDSYDENVCNQGVFSDLSETGAFSDCSNECLVYDLMGNLVEWTVDSYTEDNGYIASELRGSDHYTNSGYLSCYDFPMFFPMEEQGFIFGFRCCLPLAEE